MLKSDEILTEIEGRENKAKIRIKVLILSNFCWNFEKKN